VLSSNKEELNGINLDCLTPVNQQEANDYLQFLAELSTAFQKQKQAGSSSSFQLSITLHPGQYLPTKAYEFVDRLLIMTYDMPSSSGHHASMDTVKRVIDGFLENQAPADKMVLGIPAYARDAENPGEVKTFSEIVDELKPSSLDDLEVKRWGNYPFDSPSVVQEKTAYAREKGLAGVFLWEIGQDKQHALGPGGLLLEASYRESIGTYTGKESLNEEL
jgi:GH18 family chitinase